MTAPRPRVTALTVGDEPDAWRAVGFTVAEDGSCRIGSVVVHLTGPDDEGRTGLRSWTVADLDPSAARDPAGFDLDGVLTVADDTPPPEGEALPHDNRVTQFDHLVLFTPDLDRTCTALAGVGLELRRTRDAGTDAQPMTQAFYRLGEVVLEVVGPRTPTGDGPAHWFGLAFTTADLDGLATALGPALGRVKEAVQAGRRIATLRHREVGCSLPTAFMDGPPPRARA